MFVSTLNVCLVPVEARRECLPRKKQDKGRGRGKGRRENEWRGDTGGKEAESER